MADQFGIVDAVLSGGRAVQIDLHRVTMREYRTLFENEQPQEIEDQIVAKACGMSVEDYLDLPQPDVRRIILEFLRAAAAPLKDPNSASASTSA